MHRTEGCVRRLIVLGIVVVLAACSGDAEVSLVGEWTGRDTDGQTMQFVFRSDGTGLWVVPTEGSVDSVSLRYTLNRDTVPHLLDLTRLDRGPLAGAALYGILAFDGDDVFQLDLEPGPPGAGNRAPRPARFSAETVVFTRVR